MCLADSWGWPAQIVWGCDTLMPLGKGLSSGGKRASLKEEWSFSHHMGRTAEHSRELLFGSALLRLGCQSEKEEAASVNCKSYFSLNYLETEVSDDLNTPKSNCSLYCWKKMASASLSVEMHMAWIEDGLTTSVGIVSFQWCSLHHVPMSPTLIASGSVFSSRPHNPMGLNRVKPRRMPLTQ